MRGILPTPAWDRVAATALLLACLHLHQAYYRYPRYNDDGAPYGGAGLKVVYYHYVGTAAGTAPGVYKFGSKSDSKTVSKGDWISN